MNKTETFELLTYDNYGIEVDAWGRYIITSVDGEIIERGTLNQLRGLTTLA